MRFRWPVRRVLAAAVVLFGLAVFAVLALNPERAMERCIHKAHVREGDDIDPLGWRLDPPGYHCVINRHDGTVDKYVVYLW